MAITITALTNGQVKITDTISGRVETYQNSLFSAVVGDTADEIYIVTAVERVVTHQFDFSDVTSPIVGNRNALIDLLNADPYFFRTGGGGGGGVSFCVNPSGLYETFVSGIGNCLSPTDHLLMTDGDKTNTITTAGDTVSISGNNNEIANGNYSYIWGSAYSQINNGHTFSPAEVGAIGAFGAGLVDGEENHIFGAIGGLISGGKGNHIYGGFTNIISSGNDFNVIIDGSSNEIKDDVSYGLIVSSLDCEVTNPSGLATRSGLILANASTIEDYNHSVILASSGTSILSTTGVLDRSAIITSDTATITDSTGATIIGSILSTSTFADQSSIVASSGCNMLSATGSGIYNCQDCSVDSTYTVVIASQLTTSTFGNLSAIISSRAATGVTVDMGAVNSTMISCVGATTTTAITSASNEAITMISSIDTEFTPAFNAVALIAADSLGTVLPNQSGTTVVHNLQIEGGVQNNVTIVSGTPAYGVLNTDYMLFVTPDPLGTVINLPATPFEGQTIIVKGDGTTSAVDYVEVNGGAINIDTGIYTLIIPYETIRIMYSSVANLWLIW